MSRLSRPLMLAAFYAALTTAALAPQPAAAQGYPEWGNDDAPRYRVRPPLWSEPLDAAGQDETFEDRNWRRFRGQRDDERRYRSRRADPAIDEERDEDDVAPADPRPRVQQELRRNPRRYEDRYEDWQGDDQDAAAEQPDSKAVGVDGGPRPNIEPVAPPVVAFSGAYAPGSIVIDTNARKLFYVRGHMSAFAYPIGVGREGFSWTGKEKVSRVADWPDWYPPAEMRKRKPELPERMLGGLNNPLGVKAIYLGNTLYRIHGTNDPKSIGRAESSGCFRMRNPYVLHLASLVRAGTEVTVVRSLGRAPQTAALQEPIPKPKARVSGRRPLPPRTFTRAPAPPLVRWSADPDRGMYYDERDFDLR